MIATTGYVRTGDSPPMTEATTTTFDSMKDTGLRMTAPNGNFAVSNQPSLDELKEMQKAAYLDRNGHPVDLNIKKFKKSLDQLQLTKAQRNAAIRMYKEKSWGEYAEIVGHEGHFPTHDSVPKIKKEEQSGK